MIRHIPQYCVERTHAQGLVPWDGHVMFTPLECGQSYMATGLSRRFIAVPA
jgi:hypothetical protein